MSDPEKATPALTSTLSMLLLSFGIHLAVLAIIRPRDGELKKKSDYEKVMVHITEKPKEPPPAAPPPKLEEKKPKEKEKTKTPPAATKSASPAKEAKPAFGLNPKSFDKIPSKDSVAMPAGNTIAMPDDGKRITPEEVQGLAADLSSDAELIPSSFIKPDYTAEAENTGLEGSFTIEVFVDKDGNVVDVEIEKKVGFGMDSRLIEAAKKARFKPRKDQRGQPISGWTKIKIRLTLK